MNKITVNGNSYYVGGKDVVVRTVNGNTTVTVNGNNIVTTSDNNVKVTFEGDLANLDCTSCTINGNVKGDVDCTSIKCGDVGGNIDCTSINCGDVKGNIDGTTVNCKSSSGTINI